MSIKTKLNLSPRPKKETELIICDQFLESHFKKKMDFIQLTNDPPDFKFKMGEMEISIELTMLMKPQIRQQEATKRRIVELAHSRFNRTSDLQLRVLVTFLPRTLNCDNSFIGSRADEIFNNVLKICNEAQNKDSIIFRNQRKPFDEYVETLSITSQNEFEAWQPFGAFVNQHADTDFIQSQIDKKSTKLNAYMNQFAENWLLMASNLGHESTAMRFDWIELNLKRNNFDKIFLYDIRSKEIWEV